jgi:XTP/dITP diphosphohydrolase
VKPSAVVLISPHAAVLPIAVLPYLRAEAVIAASATLPEHLRAALGVPVLIAGVEPDVLITTDLADPAIPAGATIIGLPQGAPLVEAAAVMDRLRSPGGCPWDADQTHESLKRYFVEEVYEFLEAVEVSDRAEMLEELGDVLLQVLFHARVAAEHAEQPFDIDAVATALVAKLVGRHPHVFADGDPNVTDTESQQNRWEELKQQEKQRTSITDGVAFGQPAVALAAKLASRAMRAKVPLEVIGTGTEPGEQLLRLVAEQTFAGVEAEGALRAAAKDFANSITHTEQRVRADGQDPASLDAEGWTAAWMQ